MGPNHIHLPKPPLMLESQKKKIKSKVILRFHFTEKFCQTTFTCYPIWKRKIKNSLRCFRTEVQFLYIIPARCSKPDKHLAPTNMIWGQLGSGCLRYLNALDFKGVGSYILFKFKDLDLQMTSPSDWNYLTSFILLSARIGLWAKMMSVALSPLEKWK